MTITLKSVVPAIARNAHYTRDEMTYKITFDDGSHIIATWEHQLMKRDGSFERL
jgi:cytochrome b561